MKKALTLIELLVVVIIICIIIVVSSIGLIGMLASAKQSQAVKMIESALLKAKNHAQLYHTTTAVRIERAFEVDGDGQMMKDENGTAMWKNNQQVTFLVFGYRRSEGRAKACLGYDFPPFGFLPEQFTFRKIGTETKLELPQEQWVAPGHSLEILDEINVEWQPSNQNATRLNPFETFYVLFDRTGRLKKEVKRLFYFDETQRYQESEEIKFPAVEHPFLLSASLLVYNRSKFKASQGSIAVLEEGVGIPLSRTGDRPRRR